MNFRDRENSLERTLTYERLDAYDMKGRSKPLIDATMKHG